ncbi:spermidine synthase [Verticiella sediminum]|uniref:Spermidine synthase n=1 Tax=Verticiella sediminum TaxID=1247510 RepID=A0A556AXB1_9BURK|nr:spermidine synthase [Verticiella sediminum]TSH97583.1 spermidine synthase [Verticiella sediminum]
MPAGPSEQDAPLLSDSNGVRYLHFGSEWVQGAMAVADPAKLVLEYTRQMMAWLLFLAPPKAPQAIGTLGLGAGSLARYCLKHTPSRVRAVEWNAQVASVCRMFFRLPADGRRLQVDIADAADWVADPAHHGTCPALMVDLYDWQAQGPVRDSVAFYADCRRVLGEVGVLTVNLFGAHESFPRNITNLDQAFDGRVVVLPEIDAGNRVALAFTGPVLEVTVAELLARAETVEGEYKLPARRWARTLVREAGAGRAKGDALLRF